jgi:hypothetical protein
MEIMSYNYRNKYLLNTTTKIDYLVILFVFYHAYKALATWLNIL